MNLYQSLLQPFMEVPRVSRAGDVPTLTAQIAAKLHSLGLAYELDKRFGET
jgi:hypothetical protein